MNHRLLLSAGLVAAAAIAAGQITFDAFSGSGSTPAPEIEAGGTVTPVRVGAQPDVFTFEISGLSNWSDTSHRAYSVGTTSCNQGDVPLTWNGSTNQHPVISQSMYRYRLDANGHGRFEQIGQSWLKHGFCALDQSACDDCQGTGCGSLGVGCSDPYTSSRNGSQNSAGPKYQINATTGFFPYPPASPSWSGATARRLRVDKDDVEAASNPGAVYYLEAHYIHPQDSAQDSVEAASNNASHRRVQLNSSGSATGYIGSTVTKQPAAYAWRTLDPGVKLSIIPVPSEGTVRVMSRAYDNGDGTWDYEYFVHNLDLDRSVGGLTIPVVDVVSVTGYGFHDVDYHSGDGDGNQNFDGTDWTHARASDQLVWETESFAANPSANAIRWDTGYNFRFTANAPPVDGTVRLDLFKPGGVSFVETTARVPDVIDPPACPADLDGDGAITFDDLLSLLAVWGPCPGCPEDLDGDGQAGFGDLLEMLAGWGPC